jgi:hypothetical protein
VDSVSPGEWNSAEVEASFIIRWTKPEKRVFGFVSFSSLASNPETVRGG